MLILVNHPIKISKKGSGAVHEINQLIKNSQSKPPAQRGVAFYKNSRETANSKKVY